MAQSTYIVKQFGIVSVGKFFAVFGLIIGFLAGIVLTLGLTGMGSTFGGHMLGFGAGLLGLVIMTILGGLLGFVSGAIAAIVYNLVLGASGGVEVDLEVKA